MKHTPKSTTHWACPEMIELNQGETSCCQCSFHSCKIQAVWEKHPEHICAFNDGESICECYDAGFKADKNIKVSMLRQWLNEDRITDPSKMVSNEQIKKWLNEKTTKVNHWVKDSTYCDWFECENCQSRDITYWNENHKAKYCGGCGYLINWGT